MNPSRTPFRLTLLGRNPRKSPPLTLPVVNLALRVVRRFAFLLVVRRFAPPALRVLQPFFAAADLLALVMRVDFLLGDVRFTVLLVDFRRTVLAFLERAALFAALDLLVALALRVLQPFFAAADLLALDGPLFVALRVEALLVDFLFLDAAAFLAAEDLFAAFLLRVAAAFLAAWERFAAFLFLVAAAFFAAADLEAFVPPLRTDLRADLLVTLFFAGILFTFFELLGGFTKTSLPSLIGWWVLARGYNRNVLPSIFDNYIVVICRGVSDIRR